MIGNAQPRSILYSLVYAFPLALGLLGLLAACVSAPDLSAPDPQNWIRIGVTTKDEVITRYGQPDLVIASREGETAVYRPTASSSSVPQMEIPTVQAGPLGSATTQMRPINPGLDANDRSREGKERVRSEIHIRYDARGVVREMSTP
jgi:hypothetical protein